MALSYRHSSVPRIPGSGIDATSMSAGSAGGPTYPATLTPQPIGQRGDYSNELEMKELT